MAEHTFFPTIVERYEMLHNSPFALGPIGHRDMFARGVVPLCPILRTTVAYGNSEEADLATYFGTEDEDIFESIKFLEQEWKSYFRKTDKIKVSILKSVKKHQPPPELKNVQFKYLDQAETKISFEWLGKYVNLYFFGSQVAIVVDRSLCTTYGIHVSLFYPSTQREVKKTTIEVEGVGEVEYKYPGDSKKQGGVDITIMPRDVRIKPEQLCSVSRDYFYENYLECKPKYNEEHMPDSDEEEEEKAVKSLVDDFKEYVQLQLYSEATIEVALQSFIQSIIVYNFRKNTFYHKNPRSPIVTGGIVNYVFETEWYNKGVVGIPDELHNADYPAITIYKHNNEVSLHLSEKDSITIKSVFENDFSHDSKQYSVTTKVSEDFEVPLDPKLSRQLLILLVKAIQCNLKDRYLLDAKFIEVLCSIVGVPYNAKVHKSGMFAGYTLLKYCDYRYKDVARDPMISWGNYLGNSLLAAYCNI